MTLFSTQLWPASAGAVLPSKQDDTMKKAINYSIIVADSGYDIIVDGRPYHCEPRAAEGSGKMVICVEGIEGHFNSLDDAVQAILSKPGQPS